MGEDALVFLHGQFTQELRPGKAQSVAYGLWLNQKGRVLADSTILRVGPQELWLISLLTPAKTIQDRLESYIIADDVQMEIPDGDWRAMALVGPTAAEWLAGQIGGLPVPGEWTRVGAGFVFPGRRGAELSWEWISPDEIPEPAGLSLLSGEEMERMRIRAGIPLVPVDIGPGELPNEGGLEDTAVSYTKGCYLGQEVMARLKAMGQIRRRLLPVRAAGPYRGPLPAPLYQGEKKVGELRSVAADGLGGCVGLALCTLLTMDPAAMLSLEPSGAAEFSVGEPS